MEGFAVWSTIARMYDEMTLVISRPCCEEKNGRKERRFMSWTSRERKVGIEKRSKKIRVEEGK